MGDVMSDKFEASNGVKVWRGMFRDFAFDTSSLATAMPGARSKAITEFVLHERDEELGRWRWPENPDYVVYRTDEDSACAVDERTGESSEQTRDLVRLREQLEGTRGGVQGALVAYFAAHPEPKQLPDEPGTVLKGTGANKTILHRNYPVAGQDPKRPWTSLGGATYSDAEARAFFHDEFVRLVEEAPDVQ